MVVRFHNCFDSCLVDCVRAVEYHALTFRDIVHLVELYSTALCILIAFKSVCTIYLDVWIRFRFLCHAWAICAENRLIAVDGVFEDILIIIFIYLLWCEVETHSPCSRVSVEDNVIIFISDLILFQGYVRHLVRVCWRGSMSNAINIIRYPCLVSFGCSVLLPAILPCIICHEAEFCSSFSRRIDCSLPALFSHVVVHHNTFIIIPCIVSDSRSDHLQYLDCRNSNAWSIFCLRCLTWRKHLAKDILGRVISRIVTSSRSIFKVHGNYVCRWEDEWFCIGIISIIICYRIYLCIFIFLCAINICIRVSSSFVSLQIQLCLCISYCVIITIIISQIVWQDITCDASRQIHTSEEHIIEIGCCLRPCVKRFFHRSIICIREIVCHTCQRIVRDGVVSGNTICYSYGYGVQSIVCIWNLCCSTCCPVFKLEIVC